MDGWGSVTSDARHEDLEGMRWTDYDDGSGCLKDRDGKVVADYDIHTSELCIRSAEHCIERDHYVRTWGWNLSEIKAYAEEEAAQKQRRERLFQARRHAYARHAR